MSTALGTRNTSGTYSLPSGNPVVSGQTISSTWANNTLSDIGTELTDSLSRSGKGPMLAVLECVDGTVAAPAVTFDSDVDTGLYSVTGDSVGMTLGGTMRQTWAPASTYFNSTVVVDGGGAGLALHPGNSDHVYMEFYADDDNLGARSGFIGYSSAGADVLTIQNQHHDAGVVIAPSNGLIHAAGHIQLDSDDTFASTVGFTDTITPVNTIKAWGLMTAGSATPTINAGFNITSASCSTNVVTVSIEDDMGHASNYGIIGSLRGSTAKHIAFTPTAAGTFEWRVYDTAGSIEDLCSIAHVLSFMVLGAQ